MKTLILIALLALTFACGKNETGKSPYKGKEHNYLSHNKIVAGTNWETAPANEIGFATLRPRDRHLQSFFFRAPQDGVLALRLQKSGKGMNCERGRRTQDFSISYKMSLEQSGNIRDAEVRGQPFTFRLRQDQIIIVDLVLTAEANCESAVTKIFAVF